ncbi:unnamed protein product [Thelazia callipaeda]|uniref:CPG4 domain-containing protein n=1 Tax=Thelazia callipaeda TaxID=103827 RepID=A0A0N5CZS0_THECL|nr:unnamed protein product [Thelazia callipaeda]
MFVKPSDTDKQSKINFRIIPEVQSTCNEDCLKPFLLSLRASFVSGNNYERLVNTCEKLREVYNCVDRKKKCQMNHFFEILMDGVKYMCIEHPADCKHSCRAHKIMTGWFIYLAMRSTTLFRPGIKGSPPRVNPFFFRKITTEACSILECYFFCLKAKYNSRCYGIGGSMLMEVIARPLFQMHNSMVLGPIWNILRIMMPSRCNFLLTDSGLAWHRIDEKLDHDLREFYKNRTEPLVKFRYLVVFNDNF